MEQHVGRLVKMISERIESRMNAELRQYGITLTQSKVLALLKNNGGGAYQQELEEHLCASHATVSGVVKRLLAAGYIRREICTDDRRAKRLVLTEAGEQVYAYCGERIVAYEELAKKGFSEHEKQMLIYYMTRVYSNLNEGKEVSDS